MFPLKLNKYFKVCQRICSESRKLMHNSSHRFGAKSNQPEIAFFSDVRLQKFIGSLQKEYTLAQKNEKFSENYEYLKNVASLNQTISSLEEESKELEKFITEVKDKDEEMFAAAQSEKIELEEKLGTLKSTILEYLVPEEAIDDKDIIMELSAGVGGQEAMLFTKDMLDMYCNFIRSRGWSYQILQYDGTGIGGLRNVHIAVSGENAYKILKFECGVHRVQRVPKTEKTGRIHTSTMTVAVLPQPSEIDIKIDLKDITMEFKRSGGAGGQHVNTTDSCVRILHKPSGIIVESQMERDQHKNRELALKSLRAKLYERELESRNKEKSSSRKLQVGTAARSEKIRTYNFLQDRITDHRAHINLYGVESFFEGNELLVQMIETLQDWNNRKILMELIEKCDS